MSSMFCTINFFLFDTTMSFILSIDAEKMAQYHMEEKHIREENLRLQRRLQLEMERRENLCRHLSESESSLEMDDERLGEKTLVVFFTISDTLSFILMGM